MNKQMCFFDKNVLVEPEFYNYSSYRTVVPFDPPMQIQ